MFNVLVCVFNGGKTHRMFIIHKYGFCQGRELFVDIKNQKLTKSLYLRFCCMFLCFDMMGKCTGCF